MTTAQLPATIRLPVSQDTDPAAQDAAAFHLRGLDMSYAGPVHALRQVDLVVRAGSHVAILGPSGSGKTTLLGCLSGRLRHSAGEIERHGRIATIYQDLRLVKQRSAFQNVLHGAMGRLPLWRMLLRFPAHERRRAVQLLERVGLGHRIHTRVGRLSGGEQQRVAIARALMQEPANLLADEPVAALDGANASAIMHLLSELQRERGLTLVSVLHDRILAETHADRILSFDAGRIVHDERADDARGRSAEAPEAPTGLRGFRRFDACHACQSIAAAAEPAAADSARPRPRPLRYALAAAIILGIYAWALGGLQIEVRGASGPLSAIAIAAADVFAFAGKLIPSTAQLAAINWPALGESLLDTLRMALVGTTLAVFVAWPLAALAARNVGPRWIRPVCRFALNAIRSVPSIIWALLFVGAVGLGPFAGVLALVAYSLGYLTKFYYEAFEAVDAGTPDALREIGAGGLASFLHAIWPASRAAVLSSSLFMLEYNVRAASVLGIVGAGGIGHELKIHTEWGNWHVVGAILLVLGVVVLVLDAVSSRIRARIMRP